LSPVVSYVATLAFFGVAFSLLHAAILWLGLPDLAALLLFAIPVVVFIAYCTEPTRADVIRAALRTYLAFALVTLASGGIVYLIG
jgi:hypothetical protein